jgi:hypothetical protein
MPYDPQIFQILKYITCPNTLWRYFSEFVCHILPELLECVAIGGDGYWPEPARDTMFLKEQ